MLLLLSIIFFCLIPVASAQSCSDADRECRAWAEHGHCIPNTYVYLNCRMSCKTTLGTLQNDDRTCRGTYIVWHHVGDTYLSAMTGVRNSCPHQLNPQRRQQSSNELQNVNGVTQPFHTVTPTPEEDKRLRIASCQDQDPNCIQWARGGLCREGTYVGINCRFSCNFCASFSIQPLEMRKYDPSNLSQDLRPLGFLLGKWREEFRGKASFPTMPTFSYGEEIDFSIAERTPNGWPALNYSAHAWGLNTGEELHGENGFLTAHNWKGSLSTVMSNGFIVVEEATLDESNSVRFRSKDIDRVTFSRDLPVKSMMRKLTLLSSGNHLEQQLSMETITNPMAPHTRVVYTKIFP